MKKKLFVMLLVLSSITILLIGCGNDSKKTEVTKKQIESSQPTQEEINKEIKKEAVKGDFVKINGDEMTNKSVYVNGKVSNILEDSVMPSFTLTTKESKDGYGMYEIKLVDKSLLDGIKKGSKVTVYGKVLGRNESGMPSISGNIIELDK